MNEVNASVSERSELTGQSIHHYHFRTSNAYKYIESNAITANGLVLAPTFCVIESTYQETHEQSKPRKEHPSSSYTRL